MGESTVSTSELVARLDALDADVSGGASTSAYADLQTTVNLNAVAIGLGLEDVTYDPERFPGIVHSPDAYDETVVVVFGNGTLFVDSGASVGVHEIIDDVTEQLVELGLLSEPTPSSEFSLTPTEVPVPPEYEETATRAETDAKNETADREGSAGDEAAAGAERCDSCGHELAGNENFCPDCGEEVRPSCPACGHELAGGENFCPECGTGLAAD
ncbi:zinc-ribbon domain-containing protein [Halobellus rarus]|uniref:Zinc-ribbon domain-containing protein n=1 Tax=Halobellus rarus TaxID=1126237 RepID=A0ABD6CNJ1_9EURY|nr:zinc ribbon domain-containing protein [Halobellus rarus]